MIKFSLYENHLTSEPGDYMAMTTDTVTVDQEAIIERILQRGSTVTKPDILSVLEDYNAVVQNYVKDGSNVITPLYRINQSISGVFNDRQEAFDRSRHRVNINLLPGEELRKVRDEISVEKVDGVPARPMPVDFRDINSGSRNDLATPGGMGEVVGNNLKFDDSDAQQGIFFIAADGTENRVDTMARNKPSNLIFMIPAGLAAGTYSLEVRSILSGLKNLRSGMLDAELTVSS